MSAEDVLKQFQHAGDTEEDHLYRFLSNLFILYDNCLPPAMEKHVKELLNLRKQNEPAQPRFEYLKAA
jgi:hypothetical protein